MKDRYYAVLIKYFLHTGELIFDRSVPEYRFNLIESGRLQIYHDHLVFCGIHPPFRQEIDMEVLAKRMKILPRALEDLKKVAFDWRFK